jgi:emp24/gp25L/p24 family/GOLD
MMVSARNRPSLQVPAGQRRALTFTTRSNFKNARIAGNVSAQGGSGNDIRVLVVRGSSLIYDSGHRRSIVMSVDVSEPGQYTIIFDNSFSVISPKIVTRGLSLVDWGVDTARSEADAQESVAHYAQASRIVQRLFDVLKADERVLRTSQLAAAPTIRLSNEDSINAVSNWATNTIQE